MRHAKQKLVVGFLIDRWQPGRGGAERALAALAAHLAARGHAVLVFAAEGPRAGEDAPGELRLVRSSLALSRGARERKLARALVSAARASACDVTIGIRHLEEVDLYWPHAGLHAAALAARRESRRAVAAAASDRRGGSGASVGPPGVARGRHRAFVELERALLERGGARAVVCVSRLVEEELARAYPLARERLVRIENGVDLERFRPEERARAGARLRARLGLEGAAPLLVFAAREPELKGLRPLLAALARLQTRAWTLLVAGTKHPRRWSAAAVAAGIARERVRVVAEADPLELAAGADLCVLPTWRDTSGLVLLEALAAGTPVVTTRRAGAAARIGSAGIGTVLDDPGDAGALSAAIGSWLARIERGGLDREAVRAAVGDLGHERWLARLEELVVGLARER